MASKIVVKGAIKRQPGKLYFIDKSGNVCETSMKRKSAAKAPAKKSTKKK